MGVVAGGLQLTGIFVIITFFVCFFLFSYLYYSKVLEVDEEALGSNEVMTEGMANSITLFLLSWILSYTFI